jgi:GDP-L-fucose synthase
MPLKTVLVTGGSGLVGKAVESIQKNYNYYFIFLNSKKCNLTNYTETEKVFREIKPDYIIHLAACVGGLYKNMNQPLKMLDDNVQINANVMKCAYASRVKKVIACLSTCIFPDITEYPINETMLHNGAPHESNECYAYAKRLLDIQCKYYNRVGMECVCVIPTNVYGPHDNFHLEDSHVIPGLIHRCYLAKQYSEPFVVRGTGKPLRQFIYSLDLAKVILDLLQLEKHTERVIVAPSEEVSIQEVAKLIAWNMNYTSIIFDESFADGQYRKTVDTSLLKGLLEPTFTPLSQGISDTIDWFMKHYNTLRR